MGKGVKRHRALKLLYAGLTLILLLSMVGISACGPGQPAPEEPAAPATEEEPAEEPKETRELKVSQTTLSVTIEPPDAGTVNVSPEAESYPLGLKVTLEAVPAAGYEFDRWSGDVSGSSPTTKLVMTAKVMEVTAHFK